MKKLRIAIVGAGVSGITAIKACLEEKEIFEEIVCFEQSSSPGGLWLLRNPNNNDEVDENKNISKDISDTANERRTVSVMQATIANSSKEMSSFSDFPPEASAPNFMHHKLMYNYIESYAKTFDCLKYIKYQQEVIEISRSKDQNWRLHVRDFSDTITTESVEHFDAVLVCTGHHGRPNLPHLQGQTTFKGEITHTETYREAGKYKNKKVVIVGVGNSGLDIAVELSSIADEVFLSTRSGCWILPRLGFRGGRPYDTSFLTRFMHLLKELLPTQAISYVIETMLNRRFDHQLFGLRPAHPLFHEHPTINDQLASKILCGMVKVKGDIERLVPGGVYFTGDPVPHAADAIILATGYHIDYPFLSKELKQCIVDQEQSTVNLYKYVFPIIESEDGSAVKSLAFIGVPNALGPLFPIAEMQSRWVVQVLKGAFHLPSPANMTAYLRVQKVMRNKKFSETPRHGVQVEWIPYLDEVACEFGCEVNFWQLFLNDFKLWRRLYFGPSLSYQYRLQGPHTWHLARETILTASERIEKPLAVARPHLYGKDQVSVNPLYDDHSWLFAFFWGILGGLFMDLIFFYT